MIFLIYSLIFSRNTYIRNKSIWFEENILKFYVIIHYSKEKNHKKIINIFVNRVVKTWWWQVDKWTSKIKWWWDNRWIMECKLICKCKDKCKECNLNNFIWEEWEDLLIIHNNNKWCNQIKKCKTWLDYKQWFISLINLEVLWLIKLYKIFFPTILKHFKNFKLLMNLFKIMTLKMLPTQ